MIVALAAACDASPGPEAQRPEPTLHGASLVVGTTADQWSLLGLPQAGGTAEARDLLEPERVVWTGSTELPPSIEAHALPGGHIVLRGPDGAVHTYDPVSDELMYVGDVAADAAWIGDGTTGLYLSGDGSLLEIARDGVWQYVLEEAVLWAAPADGGVLVAVSERAAAPALWLLQRDEDEPASAGEVPAGPPGIVTAWGRRAVLTSAEQDGLVVLTVSPIEVAGKLELGGTVLALSTSPSTHEVYVTLDDPPRLVAINRFNLTSRVLFELPDRATSIRSSLFGEAILLRHVGGASRIPVGGGTVERVRGLWRSDLPLGLPDGRVVATTEDAVWLVDFSSGSERVLEDVQPDRWWLPVDWNPATAIITADRLAGEAVRPSPDPEETAGAADPAGERPSPPPQERPTRTSSGTPAGFYAIVGSARQPEGIRSLVESLGDSGFATQVQSFPDEAGRTWYRGLVGPYPTRSEAEAAARQLLRERRLEAWVTEVGAGPRPEDESI